METVDNKLFVGSPKVLTLEQTKPYDSNPRRSINPRYDDIKSSILAQGGLTTPLVVTQRPDDILYMVAAGGNTRWHILNELWDETSNPCFYEIPCLVVPWKSESHCLTAHLVENELRGEMTFIDKALALETLKSQLETEAKLPLSRNEFVRQLGLLGYPISKRQLIRLDYAARLNPLIPIALNAGLGSNTIDMLRKLEKAYKRYLVEFEEDFEPHFAQALKKYDGEALDLIILQRDINNRLASATKQPVNHIQQKIDSLLLDEVVDSDREVDTLIHETSVLPSVETENTTDCTDHSEEPASSFIEDNTSSPHNQRLDHSDEQQPILSKSAITKNEVLAPSIESYPSDLASLPQLREQAHILSSALATVCDISSLIKWQQGYGFYLDLPEQPIQNDLQYNVFWFLVGLSEQHISTERTRLAKDLEFSSLILSGQERKTYERIGTPASLASFSHSILLAPHFPDSLLNTLVDLVQLCRHIRQAFRESDLWDCLTVEQSKLRDQIEAAGGLNDE